CRREEKIKLEATDETEPMLVSTVQAGDPKASMQMIKGFHGVEQGSWRWTMGRFSVTLKTPAGAGERGAALVVKLSVPDPVTQRLKRTTLNASIQNTPVGSATYTTAGEQTFRTDVPPAVLKNEAVTVEFALEPFLAAGTLDGRELGVIFVSASLNTK
ncbi:MAG TPA: hypothetical protein VER03_13750, partial [Bryobacteraceae bacterium]|nr:hypothetical protein [Bryobacteraceae bacterium]